MNRLEPTARSVRPAQVWGGIRLVSLVREEPVAGLRLHQEIYRGFGADPGSGPGPGPGFGSSVVDVGPRTRYTSYIPHGLVADWSGSRAGSRVESDGAALYGGPVPEFGVRIRDSGQLRTLADPQAAARAREWSEAHDALFARELLDTSYAFDRVHRMGPFTLRRFLPPFVRNRGGQHIGETIATTRDRSPT